MSAVGRHEFVDDPAGWCRVCRRRKDAAVHGPTAVSVLVDHQPHDSVLSGFGCVGCEWHPEDGSLRGTYDQQFAAHQAALLAQAGCLR